MNEFEGLSNYKSPNDVEKQAIRVIEVKLKELEILIMRYGKSETLKQHALMKLLEAGIMAKECIKRDRIIFDKEDVD